MASLDRRGFLTLATGAAGTCAACGPLALAAEKDPQTVALTRPIPVGEPHDVVVCGGGPAGTAAAISAAREGLKVLLVEGQGQLGGMGVSGLVSHWLGGRSADCRRWVVGGIFRTMAETAAQRGFALLPTPPATKYHPHGWIGSLIHGVPFDPYAMARYLDQQVAEAKARMLLATQAVDVIVAGNRITHVIVFNKGGLAAVPAKAVIDATGDADIASRSGCEVIVGREEDRLMTPVTLQFHVENVDQDVLDEYIHAHDAPRFRAEIRRLRDEGKWPFPYEIFISVQLVEKGTMMINTSRICGIDGTDGASLTLGYVQGREETQQLLAVMREHIPGFAKARIKAVAPALGVRETRRIRGAFQLGVDDLIRGNDFPDTIGLTSYGWDLPDPKRPSFQPLHGTAKRREITPIPYRVMVPQPIGNLICPGRAVSVERDVLGPLRVQAPCFAMGEAAGLASAQVVRRGKAFADVDVKQLQTELRAHGAILEPPAKS